MRRFAFLLVMFLALAPVAARAQLVADLSKHLVAITTGFAGTDVLLFGAVDGPGDVVVVVRGPVRSETVRRKARAALIWVNSGEVEFQAPSFYMVGSTRPLVEIANDSLRARHEIGVDHVRIEHQSKLAPADLADYRKALIRLKQKRGLYGAEVLPVTSLGGRLFRSELHFPANVPVGTYQVEVFLIANGEVVSAQTTPLLISKIGVGAEVYDFAHENGAIYGIIAILLAVSAGYIAAVVFKKG